MAGANQQPVSAIGKRLGALRRGNNWTLAEVAKRTGISVGTLSKLENGKTELNFTSVNKLAEGLGIAVTDLTSPAPRVTGSRTITTSGSGVVFETRDIDYEVLGSGVSGENQGYLRAIIKPRQIDPDLGWHRHAGEEFIYVLKGTLELHTELYDPVTLKAGDSILFDSSMGHQYVSRGRTQAECLVSFSLKGYRNVADSLRSQAQTLGTTPVRRRKR